jgi:hypothetical protein
VPWKIDFDTSLKWRHAACPRYSESRFPGANAIRLCVRITAVGFLRGWGPAAGGVHRLVGVGLVCEGCLRGAEDVKSVPDR